MHSFISDRKFWAKDKFPKGIHRSGHFSREQAAMLERHGFAYQGLANGSVMPMTDEERRFVSVFQDGVQAISVHEKLWALYLKVTNPKKPVPFSLNSSMGGSIKVVTNAPATAIDFGPKDEPVEL